LQQLQLLWLQLHRQHHLLPHQQLLQVQLQQHLLLLHQQLPQPQANLQQQLAMAQYPV
jgi:hypothetical protein